ncbi:BnaC06g07090D [Brassica napus]|uniref:(rape) hypothetical protein n=1 Tax=Brassica napus TaxID=3708 RepID=A0A078H390_BRANA|nr:unnamed protein product [Brassica napus]CDY33070.1 BnaC06g07090D [Brassica napus]
MDSDMVEIAPPAFAWCSKTLEIHKGGCDTLSEGVSVKYKSNLGFDDQPAAQAITSQTMGCNLQTEVWKLILLRLDPVCNLFSSWPQLLSWLRQGSAAAPKTMRTVVAQAAIFLLWRQRNKRNNFLHNQQSINVISMFRVINQKCMTGFLFFLYFCHGVQLD